MTGSSRSRILWTVLLLAGLGCASDTGPSGPSAKRAIVAPTNFNVVTPNQLEPGLAETDRLVEMFLRHRGLEAERPPLGRFLEHWKTASAGRAVAVDDPDFGSVAGKLLSDLAPGDPNCVFVVPGLIYRTGDLRGTGAKWDGAAERVILEGLPKDWKGLFNESTKGVSVWVRVFSPPGRLIHEGYGGTELPWKIVGKTSPQGDSLTVYGYTIMDRDDLFRDAGKVARGIKIAFDPYVPLQ